MSEKPLLVPHLSRGTGLGICTHCRRGLKGLTSSVCPWCGGEVGLMPEKAADPRVQGPVANREVKKL